MSACRLGRVKEITDHQERVTAFTYDALGYLERLTQAKGTTAERSFKFAYARARRSTNAA